MQFFSSAKSWRDLWCCTITAGFPGTSGDSSNEEEEEELSSSSFVIRIGAALPLGPSSGFSGENEREDSDSSASSGGATRSFSLGGGAPLAQLLRSNMMPLWLSLSLSLFGYAIEVRFTTPSSVSNDSSHACPQTLL